jgi:hypothetical protein
VSRRRFGAQVTPQSSRQVLVPRERVVRWFENFETRHGRAELSVTAGALTASAADGVSAVARLPFARSYDGPPDAEVLASAVEPPAAWGILLVRKGGFAVARLAGEAVVDSKVGRRHVQGRTKAGGQSQQRFARRRDNQAREAYEAAAEHTHRLLSPYPLRALVVGGDRSAVDAVLTDPRLAKLATVRVDPWLAVPDPRRAVLEQALLDARSVEVTVVDP